MPLGAPSPSHSKVVIGTHAAKEFLEHFSGVGKVDNRLDWEFSDASVTIKTVPFARTKG
jgi:hypothetical protein